MIERFKILGSTYGATVAQTVVGLADLKAIPTDAVRVIIQVETGDLRLCFDGLTTSVTTGVGGGFKLFASTSSNPYYTIDGYNQISNIRMRREGGTSANVSVLYLGEGTYVG